MDLMNKILTRRSVRKYTEQDISEETIKELLKAAMQAPSAHNKQPWHFIVIRSKDTMNKIMEFHEYSKMLKGSPVVIAVCADVAHYDFIPYWPQDCAAATENILLAAHSLGLGGTWMGVYPAEDYPEEVAEILSIPEGIVPFNLIALGYPAEERIPTSRFDETRIHFEQW
jgi:nitroreductase